MFGWFKKKTPAWKITGKHWATGEPCEVILRGNDFQTREDVIERIGYTEYIIPETIEKIS